MTDNNTAKIVARLSPITAAKTKNSILANPEFMLLIPKLNANTKTSGANITTYFCGPPKNKANSSGLVPTK